MSLWLGDVFAAFLAVFLLKTELGGLMAARVRWSRPQLPLLPRAPARPPLAECQRAPALLLFRSVWFLLGTPANHVHAPSISASAPGLQAQAATGGGLGAAHGRWRSSRPASLCARAPRHARWAVLPASLPSAASLSLAVPSTGAAAQGASSWHAALAPARGHGRAGCVAREGAVCRRRLPRRSRARVQLQLPSLPLFSSCLLAQC